MEYSLDVVDLEAPLINSESNPTRCNRHLFHFCITNYLPYLLDLEMGGKSRLYLCNFLYDFVILHNKSWWLSMDRVLSLRIMKPLLQFLGWNMSLSRNLQTSSRWYHLLFRLNQFLKQACPANHQYLDNVCLQQSMVLLSYIIHPPPSKEVCDVQIFVYVFHVLVTK